MTKLHLSAKFRLTKTKHSVSGRSLQRIIIWNFSLANHRKLKLSTEKQFINIYMDAEFQLISYNRSRVNYMTIRYFSNFIVLKQEIL